MSIYDFVFFGPLVKTCGTHVRTACDVQSRDLFPSRDTQLYGKALSPLKATALCMGVVLLPECRWCRHLSAVLHAGGGAAYVQFCMGWCRWLCVAVFSETNQVATRYHPYHRCMHCARPTSAQFARVTGFLLGGCCVVHSSERCNCMDQKLIILSSAMYLFAARCPCFFVVPAG